MTTVSPMSINWRRIQVSKIARPYSPALITPTMAVAGVELSVGPETAKQGLQCWETELVEGVSFPAMCRRGRSYGGGRFLFRALWSQSSFTISPLTARHRGNVDPNTSRTQEAQCAYRGSLTGTAAHPSAPSSRKIAKLIVGVDAS